ncbi:hypothetical protein HMPREF1868_01337 [Olsenella sp. DNF00959]|nr:hypothetical protein [uncultured Olsenella sp.]KXB62673.1 hypothetical protein HMPREF1868_01337 [Olsenella sp. DNF00959]
MFVSVERGTGAVYVTPPHEEDRAYVAVSFFVDTNGNQEFTALHWPYQPHACSLQVTSTREVSPAPRPGVRPFRAWELVLGRRGARRTVFFEDGRYFVRRGHLKPLGAEVQLRPA